MATTAVRIVTQPQQKLISIATGTDGSVTGIDPNHNVRQYADDNPWTTVAGQLVSIASPSDGSVWGLDASRVFCTYTADSGWQPLASPSGATLSFITAGSAQNIWGLDLNGNVYQYDSSANQWTVVPGSLELLSATSDGAVWGALMGGTVVQYTGGSEPWTSVVQPPAPFSSLGAGAAGFVWGVSPSEGLFQLDDVDRPWVQRPTPQSQRVSVVAAGDDGTVWCLDADGNPWVLDTQSETWQTCPSPGQQPLSCLSVGNQSNIWALSQAQTVYEFTSTQSSWVQIAVSTSLVQIAAPASSSIWAVDTKGNVFQSLGAWNPVQVGSAFAWISAAADGTVWGVDTFGTPQLYQGNSQWQPQSCPQRLKQITTGRSDLVFGIDAAGIAYQYTSASGWQALAAAPAPLSNISCGSDGSLFALDRAGTPYLYVGYWSPTAGRYQQISAADAANVWATDETGYAVQVTAPGAVYIEGGARKLRQHGAIALPRWDTEDPFDETKSTHLWIVNRAFQLAGNDPDVGAQLLQIFPPFEGKIGQPFHDQVCQGLYDADFVFNDPVAPPFNIPTYKSHFYDPETGKNWLGETDPTALTVGRLRFSMAREAYLSGDQDSAGYSLGLSLHYLTDLTQPMHAANFTFLDSRVWGYHPAYESYALEVQGDILPPTTYEPPTLGEEPDAYLIQAAKNSRPYYSQICPSEITQHFPQVDFRSTVRPSFESILNQAIQITSQYLVIWMKTALADVQEIDGDTGGVAMLNGPAKTTVLVPGTPVEIGSFEATVGQVYKLTTSFGATPQTFDENLAGMYFDVIGSNADGTAGSSVVTAQGACSCLMIGLLTAQDNGPVTVTLQTNGYDTSGVGVIESLVTIVETFSA